jgi:hypothetical protein
MIRTPPPDGNNDELINACEKARRLLELLSELVDESQRVCPHPLEHRRRAHFTASNDTPWCRLCHKKLLEVP